MKVEEIKENVYRELISLNYSRKANDLKEVRSINWFDLNPELRSVINSFPDRHIDSYVDLMGIEDLDREQQFYLFVSREKIYLVDTQGYNYPRYIVELEGFNDGVDYNGESELIDRGIGLTRIADHEIFENVVSNLCTDLSEDGFSKKDALIFLQAFLDYKFDCVVSTRISLFQ